MHPRNLLPATCCLLLAGCLGRLEPGAVVPADIPDPTAITRTGSRNDWLICPADACAAKPSAAPPSLAVAPNELYEVWRTVVAAQPRTTVIAQDRPRLLLMVQDRTRVMRFVDTITIRVLPTVNGGSTFAAYSKSNVGSYDFGANRRRLEEWTADLVRRLAATA
ncbi:MAG: DUF1499 domain-containing protein [Geminicoccaceae bacterium]